MRCATEEVHRSQASAEKQNKNLLMSLNDVNKRIEEHNCNMVNLEAVRRRLTTENADLLSQLQACGFETGHLKSFTLSQVIIIETKIFFD